MRRRVLAAIVVLLPCAPAGADEYPSKPAQTPVPGWAATDVIVVKFRDALKVRALDGALTGLDERGADAEGARAAAIGGRRWAPMHAASPESLDALRAKAEASLGRRIADLNTYFHLRLAPGQEVGATIDALNALDCVELAQPARTPAPPPTPPNVVPDQIYLNAPTNGLGQTALWASSGGTGSNSKIADLEYSWNLAHTDLPGLQTLGGTGVDPFNDKNHGTAVLGEMLSKNNGFGTTGGAYGATGYIVPVNTASGYNIPAAITAALGSLHQGDVILIEQQMLGPGYTPGSGAQFGMVPVEWDKAVYDAIVTAVGAGVIVVEPAGNGLQNLDEAGYGTGNAGHHPFLPANDSGAIIVGGGGSVFAGSGDRARLAASDYGSTVDLQGWGDSVATTGYGNSFSAEGVNAYYTLFFSGTSSASAMVAAACAQVQSAYKAARGNFLPPAQVKNALRTTGSPQVAGTFPVTQNIGPRPSVGAAMTALLACVEPAISQHPAGALPTAGQQAIFTVAASGSGLTYQWRKGAMPLANGGGYSGVTTAQLTIANVSNANEGAYDVVVSNACGTRTSDPAALMVVGCPGDGDHDGVVGFFDLNNILGHFHQTAAGLPGDVNNDGTIDFFDLNIVLTNYGVNC